MIYLGAGSMVTPDTLIKSGTKWIPARDGLRLLTQIKGFNGTVYDVRVLSENSNDQHFILSDSLVVRCATTHAVFR